LLGIVPHGNLLALTLLVIVLTLKLNHAMAGLTAVASSFAAGYLDPYAHRLGDYVLSHPQVYDYAVAAWQLPLVPWTDLNNTVVMGSLLIGTATLLPAFAVTYPLFRYLAPSADPNGGRDANDSASSVVERRTRTCEGESTVMMDPGHPPGWQAGRPDSPTPIVATETANDGEAPDFEEIGDGAITRSDTGSGVTAEPTSQPDKPMKPVETRVDVIRMKDYRKIEDPKSDHSDAPAHDPPMDEALNYLLRQLRDSQQRKAA
jgi:uncharacterized protein (TIGR03546 family)